MILQVLHTYIYTLYIYDTAALRCAQPTTVAPAARYSRQGIHIQCTIYLHTSPNLLCGRVLWKFPAKSSTFSSSPFEMWHVGPTSNSSLAMASRLSRVTFARSFGCKRGGFFTSKSSAVFVSCQSVLLLFYHTWCIYLTSDYCVQRLHQPYHPHVPGI